MPRKQSGGSPASDNVNNINQGYLQALAEVPVGGQVHGMPGCQTGGSPASARVHALLSDEACGGGDMPSYPQLNGDPANLPLYKTSGGGKKSKKSKRKSKKSRGKKSKGQRAGGSDWISTQYSRGPVNYPSNPELFKKFAGPYDEYISNERLYYEGLQPGSASNYAPWPFPQKGGKKHRKSSKKSMRKKSKGKKSKGKKGKTKSMKGGRVNKRRTRSNRRRSH